MIKIPDSLVRKASGFQNGLGREWLENLPGLVDVLTGEWNLSLERTFDYPSLSFVSLARQPDGSRRVLKAGFLYDEISSEIDSLRFYDGRGAVRLLNADKKRGALLLEYLDPGKQLADPSGLDDDKKSEIAAELIKKLHRPLPEGVAFKTLDDWTNGLTKIRKRFAAGKDPFPAGTVELAERFRTELLRSSPAKVLLHADFQHYNILSSDRDPWLAVDPKGVIGDPAYEPAPFIRNCLWDTGDPAKRLSRRLEIFSYRLAIDRERIHAWLAVDSVLSAWWSHEDTGHIDPQSLAYILLLQKIG